MTKGFLLLEDGTKLEGVSLGYEKPVSGEVVFTTSMVGYPESLTDPSYFGQILVFTYPLIGNYGVPKLRYFTKYCVENFESERIWARGIIISTGIKRPSHYSSFQSFNKWLNKEKIPALEQIDTRTLTQKLREKGVMKGQIIFKKEQKGKFINIDEQNLLVSVSIKRPILYKPKKKRFTKPILLFDCGVKHGIVRELLKRNIEILRVPWDFKCDYPEEYSGIMISNGPGDPVKADKTIEQAKRFMKKDLPIFGICLGNQILAIASGAKTYKLKYGHRSSNQPVKDRLSKQCYITTQNHGFAVETASLSDKWKEWFVNLNDGTNEGICHKTKPFFTIQFHAEANPGPQDTTWVFDHFAQQIEAYGRK